MIIWDGETADQAGFTAQRLCVLPASQLLIAHEYLTDPTEWVDSTEVSRPDDSDRVAGNGRTRRFGDE